MKKKDFRIVFMGTPEFAVHSLGRLVEDGYHIAGVITAPDRPSGRGLKIRPSPIKIFARELDLPLYQPTNLREPEFLRTLQSLEAHLFVVVAFRILPESIFNMPPSGTINLHASLLPDYRGAAPINWVLINGEHRTGLTTFFIEKDIDTGQVIRQQEIGITKDMTAGELHDILMVQGAELLVDTVDLIRTGKAASSPQMPVEKPKMAPRIQKEDCRIHWDAPVHHIHNLVRGLSPVPGAWTMLTAKPGRETQVKIFRTQPEVHAHLDTPGSVITDGTTFLKIAGRDGFIQVLDLQLSGKKRMDIGDFLRGQSVDIDWRFVE